MARQGRIYSDFAESQWYAEPKRLARLGYLASRQEPGRTRPRTHYRLTAKGRRAVRDWVREPVRFSRIQMEPAWRLLAADIVGAEAVLEGLRPLRSEIADLLARLDVAEAAAQALPGRAEHLLLNHALARRIVIAHAEWLDEVEQAIGSQREDAAHRPGGAVTKTPGPRRDRSAPRRRSRRPPRGRAS